MDPIGFTLENFDSSGSGTTDGEVPIDASGCCWTARREWSWRFRAALPITRTSSSRRCGEAADARRPEPHYDAPAVRSIVSAASADDYRWSSIVPPSKSMPFQMRMSQ
jgi:hypothetical protein